MVIQTTRSSTNASTPTRTLPPRNAHPSRRSRKPLRTTSALDFSTLKLDYDPSMEMPKTKRPMGLQDAPTFWPSEKEWTDPLGYIQTIADEGKKYGIIKIIPPKEWKPRFSVDTKRFFFRTRKQELNSMEGATRSTMSYLDRLAKFHRQQGTPLTRPPSLDKNPIDLYQLKRSVDARGGFKDVCNNKRWAEVGRELGYGSIKNVTSVPTTLKNAYQKYLLPYETYLEKAKPEFLREMGLTPSPQQERKSESANTNPLGMRRNLMEQIRKVEEQDGRMDDGDEEVKMESRSEINDDMKDVTPSPPQNGLKRAFGESPARSASISTENDKEAEPVRRESKRLKKGITLSRILLTKATAPMVVGSNMAQHAHVVKSSRMGVLTGPSPSKKPGENCEVCGRGDNALSMLLCDGCDTGYHTFCLDPPLKSIPKYDWYCAQCLVGTNEFGFEDGDEYSLEQFRKKADTFREEYITQKFPPDSRTLDVTEEQVEEEFWRMVSNVQETIEVDYGADIHSTTHGSGFPTIETHPTDTYSTDPWNLNVLPLDNQSLFRHIKSDVSGMTVPWLYVGMMFSTFCWHNEDHYCYSINYQHFGATKTWYGIPASDADKFEAAMRNAVPELFETQPDLLFQLVTMLSPGRLMEEGVKVYAVDQRPNQFVITFPQAYHAGFNHGFNMNEAVNFAPSDWEEYGRACVQRYSEYKKMPVFSHDELLITAALHDSSIKTAKWLTSAMDILVDRELQSREYSRQLLPDFEEIVINEDLPSDEQYQCSVCKTYIYLSQITCHCTTNAVCPSHASELCDCEVSTRILRLRYSDQALTDLATKISDRARVPEVWSQKFNSVMTEFERPPLRTLRSLLSEAERIPHPLPELATLKAFVERANEWIDEATSFVARKHQNRRKNERVWRSGSRVQELEERDKIQRSPSYVYKLLDQAAELGFDALEIDLLREKAEAIEEYVERATKALDEGTLNTLEDYSELIEEGKGLNVDLPVLDRLERIVDQLKWVEKATELSDMYLNLNEVIEVIEEGERCGISLDHELMRQLASRRDRGRWWEAVAANLLAQETVPFEALEKLLDEVTDLSVHKDTLDRVESLITKTREASQHVTNLMSRRTTGGVTNQPPLSEARRLLKVIDELPVKPTDYAHFKKLVLRSEDWVKRGKRLFGKTNASIHQLEEHLLFVAARNEKVLDINDVPKQDGGHAGEGSETKESEDGPYCICRSGPTGEMVECDKCKEWYHMKCLKINKKKFDQNEGWDCPICDWRKEIPRSSTRPSLPELKDWIQAAETLSFRPDELSIVSKNVTLAEAWVVSIRPVIQSVKTLSIEKCRFYLRKIEGAEVFLPNEYNFFRRAAHTLAPLTATPPPLVAESKVVKKPRTKKPKLETTASPQDPNAQIPRFSVRPQYDPHPSESRILPAQRSGHIPIDHHQPQPYQHSHQHQYMSYPPNPAPSMQSLPPKGVFAPPQAFPASYRSEEHRTPVEQIAPVCGSCNCSFIPGTHNEPLRCGQCERLHHTVCIGKYGGRLYPTSVCGDCVKIHPNSFQTLPPLPSKRPALPAWGAIPPRPVGLNYLTPVTSIPRVQRAVIDLTNSRSPTPENRSTPSESKGPTNSSPQGSSISQIQQENPKNPNRPSSRATNDSSVQARTPSPHQIASNISGDPSVSPKATISEPPLGQVSSREEPPIMKDNRHEFSVNRLLV